MKYTLRLFLLSFALFLSSISYAGGYQLLKNEGNVILSYKIKINKKTGQEEIRIKLVNKAKTTVDVISEIGIYDNGILFSSSTITDCLKKGFLNNLFPPIQLITSQDLSEKVKSMEVQVVSLNVNPNDGCGKDNR